MEQENGDVCGDLTGAGRYRYTRIGSDFFFFKILLSFFAIFSDRDQMAQFFLAFRCQVSAVALDRGSFHFFSFCFVFVVFLSREVPLRFEV